MLEAAAVCAGSCNRVCWRLQLCVLEAATVGTGDCSLPTPSYVTTYSFLLTVSSFLLTAYSFLLRATHCYALLRHCLLHCYSFLPHCYSLLTAGGIHLSVVSSGLSLPM